MKKSPNSKKTIKSITFGSGPACFIAGIVLVLFAYFLERLFQIPKMRISDSLSLTLFILAILLTLIITVWGFASLPIKKRGKELVTDKAFRFFRHPIYAGFIDFFVFGLGFYMKSWPVLISGIVWIFVAGQLVKREEEFMLSQFGQKYRNYQSRTKKFIPWIY